MLGVMSLFQEEGLSEDVAFQQKKQGEDWETA